jgi:tRNA dimethylallyltransferase
MPISTNLLAIIGPTASGKSDLALGLAHETGGEILSVDSMQVYRGMDIGTAKPTPSQIAMVKHHLIDIAEPTESFTVARFVELADTIIADAAQRRVPLIAVGGTPLYYQALFVGMFEGPAADESLRKTLRELPNEELHAKLKQVDPIAAGRIHLNDTKRLIRALEIHQLTGKPISSLQTEWEAARLRHQATWIGLTWDRDAVNRRINARVKAMIAAGWLNEVRTLLDRYSELSQTAAEATGYHEIIEHVRGRMTLDVAIEQIKIATRQLARRQMKWFKRFANVHWLTGDGPIATTSQQAMQIWLKRPC